MESPFREADAHLGQSRDQQLRVGVLRGVDDLLGGQLLGELARVHDQHRVRHLVQDGKVVGDHDHALDEAAITELDEQLGHGTLRRHVERGGDLVGDEKRRVEER